MQLSEFQRHIERIYYERDKARGTGGTFMWFIEEVGELATALATGDKENTEEEFADVFAWMCTLANITDVDLEVACRKYTEGRHKDGFKPK